MSKALAKGRSDLVGISLDAFAELVTVYKSSVRDTLSLHRDVPVRMFRTSWSAAPDVGQDGGEVHVADRRGCMHLVS